MSTASSTEQYIIEESKKYFTFFNLSIFLISVTAIELVIIYLPVMTWIVYSSLVILSILKFAAVVWWFMHLRWDRMLCTVLFLMGIVLALGTSTALLLLFDVSPTGPPL